MPLRANATAGTTQTEPLKRKTKMKTTSPPLGLRLQLPLSLSLKGLMSARKRYLLDQPIAEQSQRRSTRPSYLGLQKTDNSEERKGDDSSSDSTPDEKDENIDEINPDDPKGLSDPPPPGKAPLPLPPGQAPLPGGVSPPPLPPELSPDKLAGRPPKIDKNGNPAPQSVKAAHLSKEINQRKRKLKKKHWRERKMRDELMKKNAGMTPEWFEEVRKQDMKAKNLFDNPSHYFTTYKWYSNHWPLALASIGCTNDDLALIGQERCDPFIDWRLPPKASDLLELWKLAEDALAPPPIEDGIVTYFSRDVVSLMAERQSYALPLLFPLLEMEEKTDARRWDVDFGNFEKIAELAKFGPNHVLKAALSLMDAEKMSEEGGDIASRGIFKVAVCPTQSFRLPNALPVEFWYTSGRAATRAEKTVKAPFGASYVSVGPRGSLLGLLDGRSANESPQDWPSEVVDALWGPVEHLPAVRKIMQQEIADRMKTLLESPFKKHFDPGFDSKKVELGRQRKLPKFISDAHDSATSRWPAALDTYEGSTLLNDFHDQGIPTKQSTGLLDCVINLQAEETIGKFGAIAILKEFRKRLSFCSLVSIFVACFDIKFSFWLDS
uniref:Uncharacterized protein n=1 Tax=Chromera velia CCMP2878 TaxID=1169474 RepID=A0A0G4I3X5_9ALVE|eukprot:Cvel_35622.t1-p1 / transcript=Cvel_35622.t1 / gene=Cvel_35622 / organism=Chromera_velia_CCMP2878 / gene_product=hypothetical protein / transcript_product=hypothetical protein / location=Cvel_scaffold6592:92-2603(+) / protein_length=606 / sequence_SO=supercontig / SO=protein_coding / is_pseudo=false